MDRLHREKMSDSSSTTSDIVRDTFLWRRKMMSFATLSISTAIWVVMEVYRFNFTTLASYVAMFVVTSLFVWGMMHRLLGKDAPKLSRLEISEREVVEAANTVRAWAEESVRWMFRVGAEGDWLTFVGVVAALWLMSMIGHHFDLLTLLYLGMALGLTVLPLAIRNEEKIKAWKDAVTGRCRRMYETVTIKLAGSKTSAEEKKEKKTE